MGFSAYRPVLLRPASAVALTVRSEQTGHGFAMGSAEDRPPPSHRGLKMKVTLTATTGTKILVWHQNEMFYARPNDTTSEAQICLPIDLFEVIAELAGLDLEDDQQSAEAVGLAVEAQQRLAA
jgi:hypothetical protein